MLKFNILILLLSLTLATRFDAGEHGKLFSKIFGQETIENEFGTKFSHSELVAFNSDFFNTCDAKDLICTAEDKTTAVNHIIDLGYKFDIGKQGVNKKRRRYMRVIRKLMEHEFMQTKTSDTLEKDGVIFNEPKNGKGEKVPSQSQLFWSSREFDFHPDWSGIKKRVCGSLTALSKNTDHFSTCARASGKALLEEAAKLLKETNGSREKKKNRWVFAIFAALHFLTDQFAPGHVRTPAATLRRLCIGEHFKALKYGLDVLTLGIIEVLNLDAEKSDAGFSINAIHDLDNNQGVLLTRPIDGKQWLAFGDHHYFLKENSRNREKLREFILVIVDEFSKDNPDVNKIMDHVPVWRWTSKSVEISGCPYYFVPSSSKPYEIVNEGEDLNPDRGFDSKHIWRLRSLNEKHKDEKRFTKVIFKGDKETITCPYISPTRDGVFKLTSVCFQQNIHKVLCLNPTIDKYFLDGILYPKCSVFGKDDDPAYTTLLENAPLDKASIDFNLK